MWTQYIPFYNPCCHLKKLVNFFLFQVELQEFTSSCAVNCLKTVANGNVVNSWLEMHVVAVIDNFLHSKRDYHHTIFLAWNIDIEIIFRWKFSIEVVNYGRLLDAVSVFSYIFNIHLSYVHITQYLPLQTFRKFLLEPK